MLRDFNDFGALGKFQFHAKRNSLARLHDESGGADMGEVRGLDINRIGARWNQ